MKFELPTIQIVSFSVEDILTTSGNEETQPTDVNTTYCGEWD